jgi:hypothetical protein
VHAGVVSWHGRAIVIPGRSFSGKTTLVQALIQAGATYFSDEYAVFNNTGRVHPCRKSLSIRSPGALRQKRVLVRKERTLGLATPITVGLIVVTQYRPGAQWLPRVLSPGEAVLALIDNTLMARLRPQFTLRVLKEVAMRAIALESERGDALGVAAELLACFDEVRLASEQRWNKGGKATDAL